MTYFIKPKTNTCDVVDLDIFTMSEKLQPYAPSEMNVLRYLRKLHVNNNALSDIWPKVLECSFFGDSKDHHFDINSFDGLLVLKMNAYELLKPLLDEYGEFLKLDVEGIPMVMFNPFTFGQENLPLCEKQYIDGLESGYKSIVFDADDVKDKLIFKSKLTSGLTLYCNEAFKAVVESNNLSGIVFDEDINNIF